MKSTIMSLTYLVLIGLLARCSSKTMDITQVPTSIIEVGPETTLTGENEQNMDEHTLTKIELPNLGTAPELDNEIWLNVDQPLKLADLKGNVVLIEMWTFGCINCQHVIPSLREWYEKYHNQDFVIIGNHYPEFNYEKDLDNLKQAVNRYEIKYAVAQDNDGQTWRAYNNHYWPALYLIDKEGNIRYTHIGEGAYQKTEQAIQTLLAEPYQGN